MQINLQNLKIREFNDELPHEKFVNTLTDMKYNWKTKETTQTLFPVEDNVGGHSRYHNNYLAYLEQCWATHYGVQLTPDIMWYSLLCEITSMVAENSGDYQSLFTDSTEKKDILVPSESATVLPLDLIMSKLRDLVPAGFADVFLLDFSTTDTRGKMAMSAAFADLVSPYYNYMMYCCGIASINVLGTVDDWHRIRNHWQMIADKFGREQDYFNKVQGILTKIVMEVNETQPDLEFWKKMFDLQECGSGSQTEVFGWWTDLYRVQPDAARFSSNFASHVSQVNYKNISANKTFLMKQGIFASDVEDGQLVPRFGHVILEKSAQGD